MQVQLVILYGLNVGGGLGMLIITNKCVLPVKQHTCVLLECLVGRLCCESEVFTCFRLPLITFLHRVLGYI